MLMSHHSSYYLISLHIFFFSFSIFQTAQSLLRNPNGQYSSFDMAQYVFWTGDETGVARAVEELIDENLVVFFVLDFVTNTLHFLFIDHP